MKAAIIDLTVKLDEMKCTTEIKEALGKIVIEHDHIHDKDNDIKKDLNGKVCCMPSVCASNCKERDVDVRRNAPFLHHRVI